MSVSLDNLAQVLDVFHLAKDLGVNNIAVAPVTSFGRGAEMLQCSEAEHHVMHRINEILLPFANDPILASQREGTSSIPEKNCGAGWRSFALNSNGTVRSCLFLADSRKFGNLDTDDYDSIFQQREMALFHDAPSPGSIECQSRQPNGEPSCKHLGTCIGCFAKAFRISENEYPECPWRARWFPGMNLTLKDTALISVERLSRRLQVTSRGVEQ